MEPVTEERIRITEVRGSLCEGGMLVHTTKPIVLRGRLKGGGEATSLLRLSSERSFYTWMMTLYLGLVKIEVAVLVNFGVAKTICDDVKKENLICSVFATPRMN